MTTCFFRLPIFTISVGIRPAPPSPLKATTSQVISKMSSKNPPAPPTVIGNTKQKLFDEEIRLLAEHQSLEEDKINVRGVVTNQGEVIVGFLVKETDEWLILVSPYIMRIFGPGPPSASKAAPAEVTKIYKNSSRGEFLPEPALLHSFLTVSTTQFQACEGFYTEARKVQITSILKTLQEVYRITAVAVGASTNSSEEKEEKNVRESLISGVMTSPPRIRDIIRQAGVREEEDEDEEKWFYSSTTLPRKKVTKH